MTNLVGTTLGQYQIVELIGEGGMANVYKAWQPSLRRYVALKVLAPHLANDAGFLKRFQQEAVSAANLKHTHIVTIHDVGAEGDQHYIAMEFIEGVSLAERIRSGQALAPDQVVDVISQVGSALDYAHQRGFIHRDIKPANVLFDPEGRAVLTDFGIAKALSGSGVTGPLTQAGVIFGTPHYMSPEQVREEKLDHRSDLYSLGIVCYEMLTGEVPFDGSTTHAILYAQANNPPPPLRQVNPAVPAPVEAVVNRMLAKEREARYASAGEFSLALAQAVAGLWPEEMGEATVIASRGATDAALMETVVGPAPGMQRARPRRRRWPLMVGALAVGVVVIVGAVVAVLVLGKEDALKRGQEALVAGDYAQAADEFGQVLDENPDSVEALEGQLEAAAKLAQAGQLDAAISAYEAVWRATPEDVRALRGLGQVYEGKGQWEEAANWYEKWTQAAPEDENALLALGNVRFKLRDYETVVAVYEQAEMLGADSDVASMPLGLAYYELAQYDKAIVRLQNAVNRNTEDFSLQRALGLTLQQLGRPEQAVEHLDKAVALGTGHSDSELVDVFYALGDFYFETQDYEQAISFYEKARELDPEGKAARAGEAQTNLDQAYVENAMKAVLLDIDFSNVVTEGGETYAIARTGQRVKIEGAVHLVEGLLDGSKALVVEEGTTNLITNPSFENDVTTGWFFDGKTGGTAARYEADSRYGSVACKLVAPSEGGHLAYWQTVSVTAGSEYALSVWAKGINLSTVPYLWIREAASNSVIATRKLDDLSSEKWKRYEVTVTVPSEANLVDFGIRVPDHQSQGDLLVDAFQVEQKPYSTTYSDGDQGEGYSWSDTPHTSASARTATSISLDDYVYLISSNDTLSFRIVTQMPHDANKAWPEAVNNTIFDARGADDDNRILMRYYASVDQFRVQINSTAFFLVSSAQTFQAGDWLDLVVVLDFSGNNYRFYVDGDLEFEDTTLVSAPIFAEGNWVIGDFFNKSSRMGGFAFSKYTVFSRVLTIGEVAALYRVGVSASK